MSEHFYAEAYCCLPVFCFLRPERRLEAVTLAHAAAVTLNVLLEDVVAVTLGVGVTAAVILLAAA